jgi:hypothetical protein
VVSTASTASPSPARSASSLATIGGVPSAGGGSPPRLPASAAGIGAGRLGARSGAGVARAAVGRGASPPAGEGAAAPRRSSTSR